MKRNVIGNSWQSLLKSIFKCLFVCHFFTSISFANEDVAERANILEQITNAPLFVSLGSTCTTAGMFRHFGLRNAAFPFDWILSRDEPQFIALLNSDFDQFLNPNFLIMHPMQYGPIVHSRYHVEFSHDWDASYWQDENLYKYGYELLRRKFEKRIARFKDLSQYPGKVIFVRLSAPTEIFVEETPSRLYWYDEDLSRTQKELALQLHQALRNFFPTLDFALVIIKKSQISDFIKISDNIFQYNLYDVEAHSEWKKILDALTYNYQR